MEPTSSLLRPISVETHRKNFIFSSHLNEPIDLAKEFGPTLEQFEKFAVGRYFWFILDFIKWKHIFGGGEIEKMTGLMTSDFMDGDPQRLHDITHPQDLAQVFAFSNFWVNFYIGLPRERRPHVKMSLYFRIMNQEKEYYWIMVQYPSGILDANDQFVYGLVVATDISHIKKDGKPMMSILDTFDGNCQQFFCTNENNITANEVLHPLTLREIEILRYLAGGYSSKLIASQLNLAVKTVDNHRQNMLHKTLTKTSAELVNFCTRMGYL
jgi:DNA-binding CsgD family transcriptional regulator